MINTNRTEQEIFEELESLCGSSGFLHAIAYFCFRDNTIKYIDDEISVEDIHQQISPKSLIRTEISTLIGLACKSTLDASHPGPKKLQEYIDRTEVLLRELHVAMMPPMDTFFNEIKLGNKFNPFERGEFLREPIFYGGESAYDFQYRDFALIKYQNDKYWFVEKKGYSIDQAGLLITILRQIQSDKLNDFIPSLSMQDPSEWTVLTSFTFSLKEVSERSGVCLDVVDSFINSFVAPKELNNSEFKEISDFNLLNAYPIIKLNEKDYLLFQNYSLVEAFYETPFFWFNDDDDYKIKARKNRGAFTENFCAERLSLVFGEKRVFSNIEVYNGKNRVGEIDVLVVFANRAIVLQAKSKKLTVAARKGNDSIIKQDFKKAVQDAYDQAYLCSGFLYDKKYRLVDFDGNELQITRDFQEIYPLCVVSDHYPALSFQSRNFLKYQTTLKIKPPFVMDIFLLDVLAEILSSPLYFLSYINRRVEYSERISSTNELTVLSYHLKQNLWIENDISMVQLGEDISADLDLAMLTRRNNAPGISTPEGILTKYKDTAFGRIINQIDQLDDSATIDLGFMILSLSGNTIEQVNDGINYLCEKHRADGDHHDLTLVIKDGATGLTIHCNNDNPSVSRLRLQSHCENRKYFCKANTWYGLCIDSLDGAISFGLGLNFGWIQSDEMDDATKNLFSGQSLTAGKKINFSTKRNYTKKVGRNEDCPCGSGVKYKKCCM